MPKLWVNLLIFITGGVCILLICCLTGGCAGSCVTLGGTYKDDYAGNVTWCFEPEKSKAVGVPVITEATEATEADDPGEKTEFFGYSLDDVEKILEKIGLRDIGIRDTGQAGDHPAKQLKTFLKGS